MVAILESLLFIMRPSTSGIFNRRYLKEARRERREGTFGNRLGGDGKSVRKTLRRNKVTCCSETYSLQG